MYNGKFSRRKNARGRKRSAAVVLSLLLLLTLTIGGTLAYIVTHTGPVENVFTPGQVQVEVTETFENNVKKNVNVSTEGSNIPVYVRVQLVSYWRNEAGNIIGDTVVPSFTPGENWVKYGKHYYYTIPVQPDEKKPATDLVTSIALQVKQEEFVSTDKDGALVTTTRPVAWQTIEVIAEAIQYAPEEALADAWGVKISPNSVTKAGKGA